MVQDVKRVDKGHLRSSGKLEGHDLGLITSDKNFKDIMNHPTQALQNYISGTRLY